MCLKAYASDSEIWRINKMSVMVLDLVGRILRRQVSEALISRKYKSLTNHSINTWMFSLWSPWNIRLYLYPGVWMMVWNFIIITLFWKQIGKAFQKSTLYIHVAQSYSRSFGIHSRDQSGLILALLVVEKYFFRLKILQAFETFIQSRCFH